jgi:hypothetical protein
VGQEHGNLVINEIEMILTEDPLGMPKEFAKVVIGLEMSLVSGGFLLKGRMLPNFISMQDVELSFEPDAKFSGEFDAKNGAPASGRSADDHDWLY